MAYLLYPALAAVVLLYLLYVVYRRHKFTADFKFPGPAAWPIAGNSFLLLGGSRSNFFRLCENLGKENSGGVFQLWVGMTPFVFLYNSSIIKPLVTSSNHLEKNIEYSFAEDWLGNGLITSKGEEWLRHRKMLTPCFHFNILKEFSAPVWRQSKVLLDKLKLLQSSSVDFVPLSKLIALDIICETAMGIDMGTQVNSNADYPTAIARMSEILAYRFITPWIKSNLIFRLSPIGREYHKHLAIVQGFIKSIILKKKKELTENIQILKCDLNGICKKDEDCKELEQGFKTSLKSGIEKGKTEQLGIKEEEKSDMCLDCNRPTFRPGSSSKNLALLDCLLKISQDDPSVTYKEIADQVNTFMFAGHDTISCALSFILFTLGHHPEWQEAIIEELDQEYPDILTLEPDIRQIHKGLPVLDRCIKEALRLYPPAPMIGRSIRTPLVTPRGTLPAGTTAIIHTFLLHRDPSVFDDPERFNPDRFLPQNVPHDSFSYIPFSAGPRNCIGKSLAVIEMKIVVAMIIKMFQVRSLQKPSELDLCFEIVLTNPQGILLEFVPRD